MPRGHVLWHSYFGLCLELLLVLFLLHLPAAVQCHINTGRPADRLMLVTVCLKESEQAAWEQSVTTSVFLSRISWVFLAQREVEPIFL